MMKKQKIIAFTLLSEELDSETLMSLVGGADASPISSFPHDLITPVRSTQPYTDDDIEKSKK